MSKEPKLNAIQLRKLESYERFFDTAIRSGYSSYPGQEAIDRLLEVKKRTTEAEQLPHIPEIQSFIRDELPRQKAIGAAMPDDRNRDWTALNRFFMEIVT